MEIANTVRELRRQLQLSQEQFAAFLGVSLQAVCDWERGRSQPDHQVLEQVEALLAPFRVATLGTHSHFKVGEIDGAQQLTDATEGGSSTRFIHEQAARVVAETAEQRSAFLASVSAVLAASLDYEQTLQSVANLAVPYFADWCSVDLLNEDNSISRVAVAHSDPEKVKLGWELTERFPRHLNDGYGISKVMETGQIEIVPEITDEQLVATIQDLEYLKSLQEVGLSSCIIAPLEARGRVLGTISLVYAESERHYQLTDVGLAEDLARRAAIAIDNARLHQEAQKAKAAAELAANRTARLLAVMQALSKSLTPVEVAKVIIEHSMEVLGASSGLVAVLRDNDELEIMQAIGYQQYSNETIRFFSIHDPFPLAEAVRTGQPMWLETVENRIARYPHLAQAYTNSGAKAWMSIPLLIDDRAVGGLSLSFATVPSLSEDDRAFVMALAQQSAQSVERARLYESEQKARAEAETANQVKDQFLAIVSHELRTPLNSILGWSQLLRSRKLNQETMARALETIERNARAQNQLIDDLLDISRILRGKLKLQLRPIDLTAVIEAAIESVHFSAEAKHISLQTQLNQNTGLISGDPNRLQQIVWNLLSNAIKFTPEGGRIEVKLEGYEFSRLSCQVEELSQNSKLYAQITVTDTGIGINPDFLPYIFEYFRQADGSMTRAHGGLGLGLAIVRNLVELHGGTVQAESLGEGQGSTFIVRFPVLPTVEVKQNLASLINRKLELTSEALLRLKGLQILVVDDEADTRDFIRFSLEQVGSLVTTVGSAAAALQQLTHLQPDILISDIGMPVTDGFSLIQQIREAEIKLNKCLPAIALTAYVGQEYQKQAFSAGFQTYLAKPVDISELVKAVYELTLAKHC